MSTTPTTATPAPTGVGVEVKAFFSKLGMDIKDIGTDIQKVISAAGKEVPVIQPVLNATLQQIFPTALIPGSGHREGDQRGSERRQSGGYRSRR